MANKGKAKSMIVVDIKIDIKKNCEIVVGKEPTLKKNRQLKWVCDDPCVIIFDGYNSNKKSGNKFRDGPLVGGKRIVFPGEVVKIRSHTGSGLVKYKYTVVAWNKKKLCTLDPEIIVDPT